MLGEMSERQLRQFDKELSIHMARKTILLSKYRCKSANDLIVLVRNLIRVDDSHLVVMALEEKNLSCKEQSALVEALSLLICDVDLTPHINKGTYDRRVGRLLRLLPLKLTRGIVVGCVAHRRKSMRSAGLKSLNVTHLDKELYGHLVICYENTGDLRIVKALLRQPLCPDYLIVEQLLGLFSDDDYWQMRVFEASLRARNNLERQYVVSHPYAFVWAAGRYGDRELIPEVSRCLERVNEKWRIVGIVAWAFGKLGATTELSRLSVEINEM